MKTAEELFNRLKTDEAFASEFAGALTAKREAGAANYYETMIPAANEAGYELTKEDIDAVLDANKGELTEEELGKVAGGTSCLTAAIGMSVSSAIITYVSAVLIK